MDVSTNETAPSPHEVYERSLKHRVKLTYTLVFLAMAILALLSILVFTGILPFPVGDKFSTPKKFARAGQTPCTVSPASIENPKETTVLVVNSTDTSGLGRELSDMLKGVGYTTLDPENTKISYPGSLRIEAGPLAINKAYTIARLYPDARITYKDTIDDDVTITIGRGFTGILTADEISRRENVKTLEDKQECIAVNPKAIEQARALFAKAPESNTQ